MINENSVLQRQCDESIDDYTNRICSLRSLYKLTWDDVADIINEQCNLKYSESHYRKKYRQFKGTDVSCVEVESSDESVQQLKELLDNIKRERVKLSDERLQCNAWYRRLAREDTLKEIASDFAEKMEAKKMLSISIDVPTLDSKRKAILQISDWHYGIEIENHWNKFNTDIAKERISQLLKDVKRICKESNIGEIYVANLGDMISGRIHQQLRMSSRIDAVTQTMQVSELIAEFLCDLSSVAEIHYFDCLDNHSRVEPNKTESMDLESFARLIPWYLSERLSSFADRIHIHNSAIDSDMLTFDVFNFKVIGVHGHKDKPSAVIDNLTTLNRAHYDLILTAHLHHFAADEKNCTIVLSNGSLMGTDDYAKNLRLDSTPSQNLIIVSPNNITESIYRIILK